jgi:hypothetical protein
MGGGGVGGAGNGGAVIVMPDGGASCAVQMSDFLVVNRAALACDPNASGNVCTVLAPNACGCPQPANATGNLAADDANAYAALAAAGCAQMCFGCPDPSTMFAQCLPTPDGGQCGQGPG